MKIKTSELTGPALDWVVAKCEGLVLHYDALLDGAIQYGWWASGYYMDPNLWICFSRLNYSTDWAQGGPIIARIEGFYLKVWLESNREGKCQVEIHNYGGDWIKFGPTPLIAAMRCYVASKLGEEVEVPDDLANA